MQRLDRLGLRIKPGSDFELVDPEGDPRYREYWAALPLADGAQGRLARRWPRTMVRTRNTVIAALMVRRGEAEAMICGTVGRYDLHLRHRATSSACAAGCGSSAALNALILPHGTFFICDTQVMADPRAEQLVGHDAAGGRGVRRFGLAPKVALLSHSSFGTAGHDLGPQDARGAATVRAPMRPTSRCEGEMQADLALRRGACAEAVPRLAPEGAGQPAGHADARRRQHRLQPAAAAGDGLSVGPILVGAARPAHILTPTVAVRGIVNMSALAVVEAQAAAPRRDLAA